MRHVIALAQRPRAVGDEGHLRARDYIVGALRDLGVNPELQQATAVRPPRAGVVVAGAVENIVGVLPGATDGPSILVVAHYDSVPTGPGAGDNGAGVAGALESLRALRAGPPLRNRIIFLFSDGEEVGLLGAHAFETRHHLARDVGLVINLDARGSNGPAIMFETNADNGFVIQALSSAAFHPVATSLSGEVYRRLPNDTDFSVFRATGRAGLNLAFIGGLHDYHSQMDDVAHLSADSVQDQGATLLALLQRIGNDDLANVHAPASSYFGIGRALVCYPDTLVDVVCGAAALGLLAAVGHALWRRRIRAKPIMAALLIQLAALLLAMLLVTLVWQLARALHPEYRAFFHGDIYNGQHYLAAFASLAIAVVALTRMVAERWVHASEWTAAALVIWLSLAIGAAAGPRGASYLFAWPVLFGTVGWVILEKSEGVLARCVATAMAAPTLLLVIPVAMALAMALRLQVPAAGALIVALTACLLLEAVSSAVPLKARDWLFSALAATGGFLVAGEMTRGFSAEQKRPTGVAYFANLDSKEAMWLADDPRAYTEAPSLVSAKYERRVVELHPTRPLPFFVATTPLAPLLAPSVDVLSECSAGAGRLVNLRVRSRRRAPVIDFQMSASVTLREIEGIRVDAASTRDNAGVTWLRFWAPPPEGFTVMLERTADETTRIRVRDTTFDLPSQADGRGVVRSPDTMPAPFGLGVTDSTVVTQSIAIDPRADANSAPPIAPCFEHSSG